MRAAAFKWNTGCIGQMGVPLGLDNGVPRLDPDGRFAGYIGSCIDIMDLKRSQVQDIARHTLELVGSVAGDLAHDFGNTLAGIIAPLRSDPGRTRWRFDPHGSGEEHPRYSRG